MATHKVLSFCSCDDAQSIAKEVLFFFFDNFFANDVNLLSSDHAKALLKFIAKEVLF